LVLPKEGQRFTERFFLNLELGAIAEKQKKIEQNGRRRNMLHNRSLRKITNQNSNMPNSNAVSTSITYNTAGKY